MILIPVAVIVTSRAAGAATAADEFLRFPASSANPPPLGLGAVRWATLSYN